jgi:N-glycosylase/DNA lyase
MKELLQALKKLKNSDVGNHVQRRIQEFKHIDTQSAEELFKELCFCILTANFNAERTIQIHATLSTCFSNSSKESLAKKLKACGYRFPTTRATYIVNATKHKQAILTIIHSSSGEERREWLVKNISGLGYKEASHFLRNIGCDDYAIIDSHIIDLLKRYHLIQQPKTLTQKRYREIEHILQSIATQIHLTVAELDLYLWYMETGKILK